MSHLEETLDDILSDILKEIPGKLAVRQIIIDAHGRLTTAAESLPVAIRTPAHDQVLAQLLPMKITEVLREIATVAVEEFTRRTGEPFLWQDDPPPMQNDDGVGMPMYVDDKGVVRFGEKPESSTGDKP